jgi:hypothetical protein
MSLVARPWRGLRLARLGGLGCCLRARLDGGAASSHSSKDGALSHGFGTGWHQPGAERSQTLPRRKWELAVYLPACVPARRDANTVSGSLVSK